MPSLDTTFCADGNKCKQRHFCFRWTGKELHDKDGLYWWANFYEGFKANGRLTCENFMEG